MSRNGKVIVAMSGGVDSSVAACLLKEQGYEPVGVFMRVGVEGGTKARRHEGTEGRRDEGTKGGIEGLRDSGIRAAGDAVPGFPPSHVPTQTPPRRLKHGCCSAEDAFDARAIARRLGIWFYVLDFQPDFDRIIDYFVDEYARARTPNPCIMCNTHLKFGKLLRYADMMDAEFVATGHYARVLGTRRENVRMWERDNGAGPGTGAPPLRGGRWTETVCLARSPNATKDQSYVLFGIQRGDLRRCLFPLGEIKAKAEVRRIAAGLGLEVYDKPESQEICFVPNDDYKRLVRARRPETARPGQVRDRDGNVLGTHDGVVNYTIGQRRGLGIAAGKPIYVTKLDALSNAVIVGPREDLMSSGLIADQVNWLTDPPPVGEWKAATIRIRHQHTPTPGSIGLLDGGDVEARFDEPQPAVTPGQAAVFYRDDGVVLGGGWIARGVQSRE